MGISRTNDGKIGGEYIFEPAFKLCDDALMDECAPGRYARRPVVQCESENQRSDREIKIAGRHSRTYYAHADKLLRDEVQLARLGETLGTHSVLLDDLRVSIRASRDGLLATQSEVEA